MEYNRDKGQEVKDNLGFFWPCPYCTPFDQEKL